LALAGFLVLAGVAWLADRHPAMLGWPDFFAMSDFPLPKSIRNRAIDAVAGGAGVTGLKRLVHGRFRCAQIRALQVLARVGSEDGSDAAMELTRNPDAEVRRVARTVAEISGLKLNFKCGGPSCGTSLLAAHEQVDVGERLGGEKGRQMVDAGERSLADWGEFIRKKDADSLASNIKEREKPFEWWGRGGSK
jgi:hypothetical protein